MKVFVVLLLAIAVASAGSSNAKRLVAISPKIPLFFPERRITNGIVATEGQFPYQVGLRIAHSLLDYSMCGGALISDIWVVTAAHCTCNATASAITVYLGSLIYLQGKAAPVQEVIVHENWDPDTISNDISLVRIPPVTLGTKINTVPLPPLGSTSPSYVNTVGVVSGWGMVIDSDRTVSSLKYDDVSIVSNNDCSLQFGANIVTDANLCVTSNDLGLCNGDSGGPLMSPLNGFLIGVTSFAGADCSDYPTVFVSVTSQRAWINSKTGL